ncbi:hypothetical protein ABIF03_001513 [Bradyrhizobium elkanii]
MNNSPAAVDAWLGREGEPEKQHDEEVADDADGAEQHLQRLADDGAAAGGQRAGAGDAMGLGRWGRRRCRHGGAFALRLAGGIGEIEIAGVDPVLFEEVLDAAELRFNRVAQHRGLLRDRGAAEEHDAGQQPGHRQADDRKPQRVGQLGQPAEQGGHGIEGDPEQHAREQQEQGGGEMPGEGQQGREQHHADPADGDRPCQVVAGLQAMVSRVCHG